MGGLLMLTAIRDIGEIVRNKPKELKLKENAKILSVLINTEKNEFEGIDIEDFDSKKIDTYLFSSGSSKGNAAYPFCPIINSSKTYKTFKKIYGWVKNCQKYADINETPEMNKARLNAVIRLLDENRSSILETLSQKSNELPKKINQFLTIKINSRLLGEYQFFKECLNLAGAQKRKKSHCVSICSLCGNSNREVSGKTDVFKFYTIDKPGFISGGFKLKDAWKNFPVCNDCYSSLKEGRKYLDNNLSFSFYGFNYLLIPKLLISEKKRLEYLLDILSKTKKEISLGNRIIHKLTDDEDDILEFLTEEKDLLTINFLFLQKNQSAERIVLAIEDVFPSRIRRIFEAKKSIDILFQNDPDKGFTFAHIRTFFSKSDENKKRSDLDKYFLAVVYSVFKGDEISFPFLAKFMMPVIRKEIPKSDSYIYFRIKHAMMVISFLEKLELIKFKEVSTMDNGPFDEIFTRYGNSFASPAKRGIFLTGTLTQLLLNKQYSLRGSKPFIKKLKGLKMDEKEIKALLPQIINKLEEYDSFDFGKQKIASEASRYLLESGGRWKMSVDEINYYFVCGMNLADELANIVYKNNKEE